MASPIFSFNLLPPKSEEQVAKEENRSNSLLYASILLFAITFAWLSVRLLDSAIVSKSVDDWNEKKNQKETEIQTYNTYKSANGQLVLKTQSLGPVVEKHTDPDFVFEFIDSLIKQTTPNVEITSYGRNSEGVFQVEGIGTTSDVSMLVSEFNSQEQVRDAKFGSVRQISDSGVDYSFTLDLDLISLSE